MTWWRKRTTERDALQRALVNISVKTQLESALIDMRRALDTMEKNVSLIAEEDDGDR